MKTELVTEFEPETIVEWKNRSYLKIRQEESLVVIRLSEAIELRDFLIQLNLGK